MKLTKNFSLSEFGDENSFTSFQIGLARVLAEQLQNVRNVLNSPNLINFRVDKNKEIGMKVTSGIRTQSDIDRLKAQGYSPSETSDHLFGLQVNGKPTLGAADVVFTNFNNDYEGIYDILVYSNPTYFKFGQIILEYNPGTNSYWIHFGNDPKLIFSEEVASTIQRNKFLVSMDNGKTYTTYRGKK